MNDFHRTSIGRSTDEPGTLILARGLGARTVFHSSRNVRNVEGPIVVGWKTFHESRFGWTILGARADLGTDTLRQGAVDAQAPASLIMQLHYSSLHNPMRFLDRRDELSRLDALMRAPQGGLAVIHGRRRLGKTRLLVEWARKHRGRYTVADLSAAETQRRYFAEAAAAFLPGFADVTLSRLATAVSSIRGRSPTERLAWTGGSRRVPLSGTGVS